MVNLLGCMFAFWCRLYVRTNLEKVVKQAINLLECVFAYQLGKIVGMILEPST